MAKPLKEKGLEEAEALQQRVRRQFMLRRIHADDFEELEKLLSQVVAKIKGMEEVDAD